MKTTTLLLIVFLFSINLFAQYSLNQASRFKPDDYLIFNPPLGTYAQPGIDYACLSSFTNRPTWVYIATCGSQSSYHNIGMSIYAQSATAYDSLGVIIWGPFNDTINIASKLTPANMYLCGVAYDLNYIPFGIDSVQYPKIYYMLLTATDGVSDISLSNEGTIFMKYDSRCGICNGRVANYQQDICMVTLDTVTQKNMIVWEKKDNYEIGSFNIYREGSTAGQFDSIGNVPYNNSGIFIDQSVNPNQKAYKYTMSGRDSCGATTLNYAFNSAWSSLKHRTIHLQASPGLFGEVNLAWNAYEGFTYPTFFIYRGSSSTNLQVIDSVSSSTLSYTDFSPPVGLNYYRVTVRNAAGCSPDGGITTYYNARSNNPYANVVGIDELSASASIKITPNPSRGLFKISLDKNIRQGEVNIFNAFGQQVYSQPFTGKEKTVNATLSAGIYFVQLRSSEEVFTQKVVVE